MVSPNVRSKYHPGQRMYKLFAGEYIFGKYSYVHTFFLNKQ